jgi:class 3 adenylate cyclase/tetratricopeptide (TPR) repeat protein
MTLSAEPGDPSVASPVTGPVQPTTERRVVSVLFADLVGFTTLAEGRDAEEVRELQDRYFATARAVVDRYGGTLEKFIGDAVMAVWGAPTGHEDDAERAVRAALELLSAVGALRVAPDGPPLEARAAVMTGEAAVSVGATDQGLVTGDLVNTASRLQGVAPAGSVLIDEPTHRATAAGIAAEPVGEQELRGRAAPVPAWRALHTLAMVRGRGRTERLEPPFVGRDGELRLLKDILHAVDDERRARLVSVTGIAGIGKSRLAWEVEKYIDGIVDDVYWHQGRSPAYGEGIALWALAEMVRGRAGIAEGDPAELAQAKLGEILAEYVPDEAERQAMTPWLLALLGYDDPGVGRQDEAFAAARRLLERIAERGLVVLVFEDLQWADSGLVEFIESILEWSRNHRILILTLARPELLERRPTWGAGLRNFTALHLDPLPDEAMTRLLEGVAPGLPVSFARRIVARAAGVPLFAVETVRMLIDDGRLVREDDGFRVQGDVGELAVPGSLRGLIGARLDALPADDRTLLQDASVLGQTFRVDALAALTGRSVDDLAPHLRALTRREILALDDDDRSPERGQYAFVQGPIREIAYETLAKRERRARHLAAARYFETLDSDELAGVLASHYLDAYRATADGPEADALAAQARVALRGAAERAAGLGSNDLALGYLDKALTVTTDPIERAHTWEAATIAAHLAGKGDASERFGHLAVDWYLATGDPIGAARSVILLTKPMGDAGRTDEAIAVLDATLTACADLEDRPEVVALVAELARTLMLNNDPRAVEVADRALIAAERLDDIPIIADALVTKAAALDTEGRRREGMAILRGAIELIVAHRLTTTEFRARSNYATQIWLDDPRAALESAIEVRELARRLGARDQFNWSTWQCYGGAFAVGRWDWMLELALEAEAGDPEPLDLEGIHSTRARIAAYRGDFETADRERQAADRAGPDASRPEFIASRHADHAEILGLEGRLTEAYELARTASEMIPFSWPRVMAGRFAIALGDPERTRRAVEHLRESSERGAFADALRESVEAGLAALEGRRDEAIARFRASADALRRLDLPLELARTQLDYAVLIPPDDPGARAAADEARTLLTGLGVRPFLERLETGLARWTDDPEARQGPRRTATTSETAPARGPSAG